jgi:DNA primase
MVFRDYIEARYTVSTVSGGRQLKLSGPCPFCGEDRSDMRLYVNPESGMGDCKHCGVAFGPVKFVMAAEGCSGAKAREILDGEGDGYIRERPVLTAPTIPLPSVVPISTIPAAGEYLERRRIPSDAIKRFGLCYCIADIETETTIFRTKGRVIIPIYGLDGTLASWQGRDITGKSKLKYLFPPGFKGAEYLFNAQSIPHNPDYLLVVEGVMDVIGWWLAGVKNVVATFGKKVSVEQMEMIRAIKPKSVFIAWDSDAIDKKYDFMEDFGHLFPVRMIDLGGKDADEMAKGALVAALASAKPYNWSEKILSAL